MNSKRFIQKHKSKWLIAPLAVVVAAGGAVAWAASGSSPPQASDMPLSGQKSKQQLQLTIGQQTSQQKVSASQFSDSASPGDSTGAANAAVQQTSTTTSAGGGGQADASVTVNGHEVALPQNGSVHKTIQSGSGSTDLDVSVQRSSSTGSSASSSIDLNVSSNSTASSDGQ